MESRVVEIIIGSIIIIGLIVIFGKTIMLSLSALGGLFSFLIPVTVLVAIVYILTLIF